MGQEVKIKRSESGRRSLFWPIVLISVGVIWLLGNLGAISGANIAVLFRLWPLALIVVGIELLIARNNPALSTLIGIAAVVLIIALALIGPSLGWAGDVEVKTGRFSEPVEDATSARINLDLGVTNTTIRALSDSSNLIDADISYVGEVEFVAEGETEKVISLSQTDEGADFGFNFLGLGFNDDELQWNIGLSPDVPLDLRINGGIGSATLDLSGLQITALDVNSGVGEVNLMLPASLPEAVRTLDAHIASGVGEFTITIPEGLDIALDINGGVGQFTIDVPEDAGVHVEADSGVGSVEVSFPQISGDDDEFLGESGTWETENFAEASQQIRITFDGGVGGLTVR